MFLRLGELGVVKTSVEPLKSQEQADLVCDLLTSEATRVKSRRRTSQVNRVCSYPLLTRELLPAVATSQSRRRWKQKSL